jgi:hypothetical protein
MNSVTRWRLSNILLEDFGRLAQEAQQSGVYFFLCVQVIAGGPSFTINWRAPLMSLALRMPVAAM